MNRSFLIILVPAVFVALGYILVLRYLGLQPNYVRLAGAGAGFLLAVGLVRRYLRRKARPVGR